MKVLTPLWKHQQALHDFAAKRMQDGKGYAWWLAGCATGKTLTVFKLIETLKAQRTLIITTKAATTTTWPNECDKHVEGLELVVAKGSIKAKGVQLDNLSSDKPLAFVINYAAAKGIAPNITKYGFDLVVTDESHKIKSHNSGVSNALARACKGIPYKIAMTGTGFDDRPTDVYGQIRWFDPLIRGKRTQSRILGSWSKFYDKYVNYRRYDNYPIVLGYKNQDELAGIVADCAYKLDSEEVLDLPEALYLDQIIKMPKVLRSAYEDMEKHFVTQANDETIIADSAVERVMRLHQITSGYVEGQPLVDDDKNPKMQRTLDILDEIGGKPVVIFTCFNHDVDLLYKVLTGKGFDVARLTGAYQEHEDFVKGKGQILIANVKAGGAAIDLTYSRYAIYYSVGHSLTNYNQSLYRIRRPTSDKSKPVTYYNLIMEKSIDVDIRHAMKNKKEVSDYLQTKL